MNMSSSKLYNALVFLAMIYFASQQEKLNNRLDSLLSEKKDDAPQVLAGHPTKIGDSKEEYSKLIHRIESLESAKPTSNRVPTIPPTIEPQPKQLEKYREKPASLSSRFSQESTKSEWGKSAENSISQEYKTAKETKDSFFNKNQGKLSNECKESVCSIIFKPNLDNYNTLSQQEKSEFAMRTQFELMSLIGKVNQAGQVTVSVDTSTSPPTILSTYDRSISGGETQPGTDQRLTNNPNLLSIIQSKTPSK